MFKKVLVANRGEIACRIIRTLREMGVASVAVFSEADENALHTRLADEAVLLGAAAARESYLNVPAILAAAKSTGAEAVHPGYGFLSENAEFARACEAAKIVFIGPAPEQLVDFGLKHRARELAEKFDVPLVPGSKILPNAGAALAAAEKIGFPVMLKSTAGGGGIGMCVCRTAEELAEGWERIGRLSRNNFKDTGLFLEKYIERSRHIEVQIFGDGLGNVAVLGERDCSVQRRNQKVVEETPAPDLPDAARESLHAAARRLGEGVAYRSAGTVEFIYDIAAERFYFLEVNTRLQVEHGVTEAVLGIDLVRWMVSLAAGKSPFAPGRKFAPEGCAMEFRIYAEDPGKDYRPSSGLVTAAEFPADVRCDTWIETGTEVSAFYDPLLAKIIVSGADRAAVIEKSRAALAKSRVAGFETNLLLLRQILELAGFASGNVSTALLRGFNYHAPSFEVLAAGTQTTVQDYPGRIGYWDVGVPPSGPMDDYHFRLANRIVGNATGAPALEMTIRGATLRFNTDTVVAVSGGDFPVHVNDTPAPRNAPLQIASGDTVKIGASSHGQRAYLAVRGGVDVPAYLGSASTFTLGKFGGHGGRALAVGDVLHIGAPTASQPLFPDASALPAIGSEWEIAVLYGPHGAPDYLTDEGMGEFFAATWEVHFNSSRTGIRLVGPRPKWARADGGEAGLHPSNLHDNAYAVGTVDFTGDMPIILGHDGPSLGGFVCPVTIVSGDLWKIGQLRSGDKVRFIPVTVAFARQLREHHERTLATPDMARPATPRFTGEPPTSPIVAAFNSDQAHERIVCRQDGDRCLLIEFGPAKLDLRLRFLAHVWMLKLKAQKLDAFIDLTPGIRSLQIHFDPGRLPQEELIALLSRLAEELRHERITRVPSRIVHLPLSWDDPATRLAIEKYTGTVRPGAPWCCPNNIEFIRRINGLADATSVHRVVHEAAYLVLGLGDVYLGAPVATPLDPRQRLVTTKYNPARTWTPENAVGIGGAYMCVYGMEGPGGYQFVGRTVQMWNRFHITPEFQKGLPYLLRFFDQIRFYPVEADELLRMRRDFLTGKFRLKIEDAHFDIGEYDAFLAANAQSIATFETSRRRAFDEERERWIAEGQLAFENTPAETIGETAEAKLAEGETGLHAPVAGSIWKLHATAGTRVKAGDTLLVMESMKTEISILADADGEITQILCAPGATVRSGQCLLSLKPHASNGPEN
jgi:urea carboxylase